MAQIIITTIDSENGSISVLLELPDQHLSRIYKTYKRDYAEKYIKEKHRREEVLESYETVENISDNISSKKILSMICSRFINDVIATTRQNEITFNTNKFLEAYEHINITHIES